MENRLVSIVDKCNRAVGNRTSDALRFCSRNELRRRCHLQPQFLKSQMDLVVCLDRAVDESQSKRKPEAGYAGAQPMTSVERSEARRSAPQADTSASVLGAGSGSPESNICDGAASACRPLHRRRRSVAVPNRRLVRTESAINKAQSIVGATCGSARTVPDQTCGRFLQSCAGAHK